MTDKVSIDTERLAKYQGVKAKLARQDLDPTSKEFEEFQAEAETLWESLTLEERAIAQEAGPLN